MPPEPIVDRPLTGAARLALVLGAVATVLLFYAFAFACVAVIASLFAIEIIPFLAVSLIGLAVPVTALVEIQARIVAIVFKSFLIGKGVEFQTALQPADAPRLFGIVGQLCARLGLAVPREVAVEMTLNAHVRLKGIRQGAGRTILVIGYDLFAGLTESEVEAVLAHEMAHAKRIRRGLRRWLAGGLRRAANLAGGLDSLAGACRRVGRSPLFIEPFLICAHRLARLAHRLVAAYSRQDEFEADRMAADLCGSATVHAMLIKIQSLGEVADRLPWRERVARHHSPEGFSRWLTAELAAGNVNRPATAGESFSKYSTHPSLRDRLSALPASTVPPVLPTGPGLGLLASPDSVAGKLIAEIERIALDEESKDARQLRHWLKKTRRRSHFQPLQKAGLALVISTFVGGAVYWLVNGMSSGLMFCVLFLTCLGALLWRLGRYRDRLVLSVPDYSLLKKGWEGPKNAWDVKVAQKELETEFNTLVAPESRARNRAAILAANGFEALAQCDYLRAYVAGRMCRSYDEGSVEGTLSMAIASAAYHQTQQAAWLLSLVARSTGFTSASSVWGGAWGYLLLGDFTRAQALLARACERFPHEPTVFTLLALCQSRRGMLQSAIPVARKACSPEPRNKEHAKLLIGLLLEAGYVAEARARLSRLESDLRVDSELIILMVRLNIIEGKFDAAEEWARLLKQVSAGANSLIAVGGHYEVARRPDEAARFYEQATLLGHYPDALLGLGRVAAGRQNKDEARRHLLAALDVKKELGPDAVGPIPLFHRIIDQLQALHEPVPNCRGWTACLSEGTPESLINKTLLIYAVGAREAGEYLQTVLHAMDPGSPPVLPCAIEWRQARPEHQPEGSVRPGVHSVLA